jgi:hypothetical protein
MATDETTKIIQQAADDVCQTLLEARRAVAYLEETHGMLFLQTEDKTEAVLRVASMMCALMGTRLDPTRAK